tara:strand:+ start:338 stop:667 length:330 start_codon:yes stop_codon:yes gene_type:complete
MRDPNKSTKFVFYCFQKESADLKIRLRYDGLKQSEFFRSLLLKYINKDPSMLRVVEDIKRESKIMGKERLRRTKKDLERGSRLLEELGITKSDRQNIFDMIEMDLEEYE